MLSSSQRKLRDYGIFLGLLIFIFAILFTLVIFSRTKWYDGLKEQVQEVLDREYPNTYIVGDAIEIEAVMSVSSAHYAIAKKTGEKKNLSAYIVRIATIYGPHAAVFVSDSAKDSVEFVGFALVDKETSERIENNAKKSQIAYWKKQIQESIKNEAK